MLRLGFNFIQIKNYLIFLMSDKKPIKPFSMIREFHLADWFTLGNAVCGIGALFSVMSFIETSDVIHVYFACALVLAALVFDVLDGRIARWRQKSSAMGRELDSLADVISFGVAPAIIGYGCGMQGFYDRIVLAYFVACGVSRLARYNVTAEALSEGGDKVKYFEGTPIPTSVLIVLFLTFAAMQDAVRESLWGGVMLIGGLQFHPLVLIFAVSGSLMISRIRIPKF
jgi:CDP-diacylglycerol---serine O-phosphatidyltransferase